MRNDPDTFDNPRLNIGRLCHDIERRSRFVYQLVTEQRSQAALDQIIDHLRTIEKKARDLAVLLTDLNLKSVAVLDFSCTVCYY